MTNAPLVHTTLRGTNLLNDPALNKGTAFSETERRALGLSGLLPPQIEGASEQLARIGVKYSLLHTDLERHIFLRALQDTNEVLFYAFVEAHLQELLPIIYTPTVGKACEEFSHIYRRPHGLFVSHLDVDRLDDVFAVVERDIKVVVVTDGERILGLGDQGLGGMGIPIGKLSLYTAVGGIDPAHTLPVLLDVGTNNEDLLVDPLYLGLRSRRITGSDYDAFVDAFVAAVKRRFPGVLLQWEDFASHNATRVLDRYRDQLLSFNDDIQGTAAVALSALLAGLGVNGLGLEERPIMIVGAGSAGTGIAGMVIDTVRARTGSESHNVFVVDQHGLVRDGRSDLEDYQRAVAQPASAELADVSDLAELVAAVQPAALVGVSGQGGIFSEDVIHAMAESVDRPVVMPLSNPTSRAEATPADILEWSGGRALVATGSPFDPVDRDGTVFTISQANNVYVFPGLGLGALAAGASRVSDIMLAAAAAAVADDSPCRVDPTGGLLPPLSSIHAASRRIAAAVAVAAGEDGSAPSIDLDEARRLVDDLWWSPIYPTIVPTSEVVS